MQQSSPTFSLRSWRMEDLESLVHYANNMQVARYLTDMFPHPYTSENGKSFIGMATKETPRRILAIDVDGQAVGGIGLHFQPDIYRKNMELGYWLAEPFWGKGIMTAAVQQMITYGFGHFDITRIFARPFGNNIASQKVLEKAGFVLEATFEKTLFKNGQYLDEWVYAVRKSGTPP